MHVYVGTSGYSYPEWKGQFYPPKTAAKDMLAYYATQLASVEINNTFYRMPRTSVLAGWAGQVGSEFRFAVKATRRITHFKKLKDPEELLGYLIQGLSHLGNHLGPVLFQLPPTLRADQGLLREFLQQLFSCEPRRDQAQEQTLRPPLLPAFEFRHPSWFCDPTFDILSEFGTALVGGDGDEPAKGAPFVPTGDFLYLRLRKSDYSPGDLDEWTKRILDSGRRQVFAYFKHEELGPTLAKRLSNSLRQALRAEDFSRKD